MSFFFFPSESGPCHAVSRKISSTDGENCERGIPFPHRKNSVRNGTSRFMGIEVLRKMQYCVSNIQRHGSCYFEFQRGIFQGVYWKDTSLYLDADDFDRLHLYKIFPPEFRYYGETVITKPQWHQIHFTAQNLGGEVKAIMDEIDLWAQECFQTESVFTILGI